MKNLKFLAGVTALGALSGSALAGLINTRIDMNPTSSAFADDGAISAGEYGPGNAYSYGGAGSGFGGTLGSGTLFMDFSASTLNVGFRPGASVNDNVVILLDTRTGGFTDATMNDTADPGRNLSSNLTRDVNDVFPIGFLADYSIVIGSFGVVVFELTGGSLNFLQFEADQTGNSPLLAREIDISRAALGLTSPVAGFNWFAGYGSDTNFMSNESNPLQPFNAGGNLGFDNRGNPVGWANYNRFEAVPEPATMLAMGAGLAALAARRRRKA